MSESAKLEFRGKTLELPVFDGSEKEAAIDISALRGKTGAITYDDGFGNTGACKSAITFLDGELGILRYRGYPIDQLAEKATFLETAWLLIKGELPSKSDLASFEAAIAEKASLPPELKKLYEALPPTTHPMAALAIGVEALSGFDKGADDFKQFDRIAIELLAKLPLLAAAWQDRVTGKGWEKVATRDYSARFLEGFFGKKADPAIAKALDVLFILHADHEQNCSTSTVRIVGSSRANPYASISAGINALWGPLHGGANQEVLEMLQEIQTNGGGDVKTAVLKAKDKNSGFRLMGFGHRVYKNFDPRAKIIKVHADKVLGGLGINDPLLGIAKELEQAALTDEYFVSRKLYPNVDFYSGIIYRALGFPTEFFTVLFAIGRLPGWLAQFKEMRDNEARIGRPRQIYTGATERNHPG